MNDRIKLLALLVMIAGASGCSIGNGPGLFGGPGLFSNVSGARIAPPATGSIQYPQQVASLSDPYYGRAQSPTSPTTQTGRPVTTNPQGWRPIGSGNPLPGSPVTYSPTSYNIQNAPANVIPSNNLTVATSTSTLQPAAVNRGPIQVPVTPNPTTIGQFASVPVQGGMPLNDATRVATVTPATGQNTGIFNRTWEYVARPNTPAHSQYRAQPVYANGTVVAASSTSPGFSGPRPNSYAYPNNNTGVVGGYPTSNVAQGWRQREVSR